MEASGEIDFRGEVELLHLRGGLIIGRRYLPPAEPVMVRGLRQRDPWRLASISRTIQEGARYGLGAAYDLLRRSPKNLITTAGVNYMATVFTGSGALINFNFHAFGTGTLQGSTNPLASPFASNATPIVITETTHGRTTNDIVQIASVTTNMNANGIWQILVLTANTYSIQNAVGNGVAGGSPTAQRINGAADTALTTDSGVARVTGTQTNPSANQYRSVATMSFSSSLAITEWGLFSASSSGTLWDRRWFNTAQAPQVTQVGSGSTLVVAPINVQNGDSIQATYTLTLNAGGS